MCGTVRYPRRLGVQFPNDRPVVLHKPPLTVAHKGHAGCGLVAYIDRLFGGGVCGASIILDRRGGILMSTTPDESLAKLRDISNDWAQFIDHKIAIRPRTRDEDEALCAILERHDITVDGRDIYDHYEGDMCRSYSKWVKYRTAFSRSGHYYNYSEGFHVINFCDFDIDGSEDVANDIAEFALGGDGFLGLLYDT